MDRDIDKKKKRDVYYERKLTHLILKMACISFYAISLLV